MKGMEVDEAKLQALVKQHVASIAPSEDEKRFFLQHLLTSRSILQPMNWNIF